MATAGQNMDLTRSKENSVTDSHGVPTGQGNYEIFPRNDQLPQQVLCTQCTPHLTVHSHIMPQTTSQVKCILKISTN